MFRTTRTARLAIAAAALAAALALPPAASADPLALAASSCTESHDTSAPAFDVRLCAPSDIDQLRTGLPVGGSAYTGPAALFNVLNGMWQRQGLPVAVDGLGMAFAQPDNPALNANATTFLQSLGNTSGLKEDLAKHRTAFHAATAYADAHGWTLASGGVDTTTTPEFGLALAQRLHVAPVQMVFAHYKNSGYWYDRQMGHMVTVVSAKGSTQTGQVELTLYDPAKSGEGPGNHLDTQSEYRLESVTLKKVMINVQVDGIVQARVRWELTGEHYGGAVTRDLVEGFNWFSATK